MTIHLHDTRQGQKVPFQPLREGEVTMYLCGPTVYNYAHIGNARPAVVFDLLARVLRRHYQLTFARNITDIDDKIIAASADTGVPIREITDKYTRAYNDDMGALGVLPPDIQPSTDTGGQDDWQRQLRRLADRKLRGDETDLLSELGRSFERTLLAAAMEYTRGHKQEAARRLGWGRNTLARKLKELGLE